MPRAASCCVQRERADAAISSTSWLTSTGWKGRAGRVRLKSWKRRTTHAPSSATCSIMRRERRTSGSCTSARRSWARARIPESVLLKSCATSPAISRKARRRSCWTTWKCAETSPSRRERTSLMAERPVRSTGFGWSPFDVTGSSLSRASGLRRAWIAGERARLGRTLELVGDLVDQVLHLAQQLGGRLARLHLLGLEAIALGLERSHLRPQMLDLPLGALGERSLLLRLRAEATELLAKLRLLVLGG